MTGSALARITALGFACAALAATSTSAVAAESGSTPRKVAYRVALEVPSAQVAQQLGIRLAPGQPDELAVGTSITGTLVDPTRLVAFGVRDALAGARVTVLRVAPDRYMMMRPGKWLDLVDGRRIRHLRSSANPLFESAASVFGARTIAVVLTGYDSDGTDGVQAVSYSGGTVLAEDPDTAFVPSMPRSAIDSGAVTEVLPLEEIAPRIVRLVAEKTAGDVDASGSVLVSARQPR